MIRPTLAALALTLATSAAQAMSVGYFHDADRAITSIEAALAFIDGRAADATFASSAIDYPAGRDVLSSEDSLAAFLGADAPSIAGDGSVAMRTSVTRFTGWLDLAAGPRSFEVGSDDGFALFLGGRRVSQFSDTRSFRTTSVMADLGAGRTPFELVYYENGGSTGVRFSVDGEVVTGAAPIAAIPLPATMPMVLLGLGAFAWLRLRR